MVRSGENIMESASAGTSIILGETDFDLAYYANNPRILQENLILKNCRDEKAFIEINIKTNAREVVDLEKSGPSERLPQSTGL